MYAFRIVHLDEIPLIRELASKTWAHTYRDILDQSQLEYMFEMMYSEENLRKQIEEERHEFFIAEANGVPAGYLSIESKTGNEFIFQKIYITPDHQSKGLGRFLVEQGVDYLKKNHPGHLQITLFVNRENRAVEFYKHIGFEVIGQRDQHIGNGFYMNDYIMRLKP